jgi:hypothetical protein
VHPFLSRYLPAAVLDTANKLNMARQIGTTRPAPRPAGEALEQLAQAMDERIAQVAPDAPRYFDENRLILEQNTPTKPEDVFKDGLAYGGNYRATMKDGNKPGYLVRINPLADRSFFAHELGHTVTDSTKVGRAVRDAREFMMRNKPAAIASSAFALGAPLAVAAAVPGDEDVAGVTALGALAAAPTLVDEALASKNALAIMQKANMPATIGQRGRLAGAFATYGSTALMPGLTGGLLGNIFDKDLTTPGELNPQ